ncbi:MAG: hypothetical protein PWP65_1424 [Clostridia bacterium]|nr:hypothetical protein [Clostridia bacterium]
MITEGVLALQAGKSPTAVRSALISFLEPAKQEKAERRKLVPRKRVQEEGHNNLERWLLTYSDREEATAFKETSSRNSPSF